MNTLIACHDAGGAEILAAYVLKNQKNQHFFCFVSGPAWRIFTHSGLSHLFIEPQRDKHNWPNYLKKIVDRVITGTGWSTDFERRMIKGATSRGIYTIAFLDHWVNYRERFGYPMPEWETYLPDELWVGDTYAQAMAKPLFPGKKIVLEPNPYFERIQHAYRELAQRRRMPSSDGVLFISEPVSKRSHPLSFSEYQVLESLFVFMEKQFPKTQITIRLHPSESPEKYEQTIAPYRGTLPITYSDEPDMVEDIARSAVVVGIESMALVAALLCGKKTVSYIPDEGYDCILPFEGIVKIRRIDDIVLFFNTNTRY